jgi:hypothetical protein
VLVAVVADVEGEGALWASVLLVTTKVAATTPSR